MSEDLNKILKDIEAEKQARLRQEEEARRLLEVDQSTADRLLEERRSKVSEFKLQMDLDSESFDSPPDTEWRTGGMQPPVPPLSQNMGDLDSSASSMPMQPVPSPPPAPPVWESEPEEQEDTIHPSSRDKKRRSGWGCARVAIYAAAILVVSGVLAWIVITGGLDMVGLRSQSDTKIAVTLTEKQSENTAEVARILKQKGIINQPMFFRLYCKFKGADGKFRPQDEIALSADMGYEAIINILKTTVREEVRVTFPEGWTIAQIAKELENKGVCAANEFYLAMDKLNQDETTRERYGFLNEIPDGDEYKGRFRKLEGYIFPDTYYFYVGSSGETALRKFLDGFNQRIDATTRAAIKAKGMTLNDTIILASIIQWEAGNLDDMYRISRVIHNRLEKPSEYPRLECDSTYRYMDAISPPVGGKRAENLHYDTYKRKGLPIGAINNPGKDAILAAINPSEESMVKGRYFFATDMKTGKTYYSQTYSQHVAICKRYGIGMYA